MTLTKRQRQAFLDELFAYYDKHARNYLPWRQPEVDGRFDPYKIWLSELMLQQTQVSRVIPKYLSFLERFPDLPSIAAAKLSDVLTAWSGLGYNRRAKYLWQAAQHVIGNWHGTFPRDTAELVTLPGIGTNTAAAIVVYAFNQPEIFVETNVRTVFIHHFLADHMEVSDKAIIELLQQTVPATNPRIFYWALMDYGNYLKRTSRNLNRLSKNYNRQTPFAGSKRQLRGQVLRVLANKPASQAELACQIDDDRLAEVLEALAHEELIQRTNNVYALY